MSSEVRIFISYAREDSARVKALYQRLAEAGFQPWLDREHIVPGQQWEPVIKRALKQSDFVLVCLLATSINKRGFLRREIKQALEQAEEKLEDDVYLIPARLDDCAVPEILEHLQWVDLFEDYGWEDLLRAFEFGLQKSERPMPQPRSATMSQPQAGPEWVQRVEHALTMLAQPATQRPDGLEEVQFTTVRLDARGQLVERQTKSAWQYGEDLGDGVRLEMVSVPGGEFVMGSPENEASRGKDEVQHRVRVSPFWMGKHQVTQAQWRLVMGKLPEMAKEFRGPQRPVVNVSWNNATEFCQRLSELSGREYRLPTEAEWEYACRAGTTTPFAFGETITTEFVNYNGNYPYGQAPKGAYRGQTVDVGCLGVANAFGFYDMHGNVWEWCQDWYGADYYAQCQEQGALVDPQGPAAGQYQVLRGGSRDVNGEDCRAASRFWYAPAIVYYYEGFRIVVSARTS